MDAFNRSDFDALAAFYAEDVAFYGQAAELHGREAVLDFYRKVKSRVAETLELVSFVGAPGRIAAELRTTLRAHEAWPDFPTGALAAGEVRRSSSLVFYDLEDARFRRIRSARLPAGQRPGEGSPS